MDVSIIIPAYNRLWSLPKAVNSCRDTALQAEIIVIDDGSTDSTWDWLQQQKDVISIRQDNAGKDWAVNKGFAIARGKYVRFLDSDDWLLPGSTKQLFDQAETYDLDIVCAGYQLYSEDEQMIGETPWTICDDFLAQQLGECDSSHYSAYLFKRDFIAHIPHRQEYGALDDRKFIIETAIHQPKTGYINTPALAHRTHSNLRLQQPSKLQAAANHLAFYKIFKTSFDILAAKGQLTQRHKNAACNNLWHLAHWVAKTDIKTGREIHDWVYELNPDYRPVNNLTIARLYKSLGFTRAEKLLRLLRRP
ncbi:glycosyltransferase family 2 protein [Mucilaginibacter mali]|uniref:Glycosyltransferase family 2 protein n=1 Tax=Mucilaginibacter mali TaxID=2740462 RepID=A0A7D4QBE7_9SPHI|nr:glycosyltransferase family 2 protein [Mucilaginibacter mali]QKJ30444.1 glycosyltransferase family 2 protein [Mucilaginibacter mali]